MTVLLSRSADPRSFVDPSNRKPPRSSAKRLITLLSAAIGVTARQPGDTNLQAVAGESRRYRVLPRRHQLP